MPYPPLADIETSYTAFQQGQGDNSFPGQQIDTDLANLKEAVDTLNEFVRGVTRSDGEVGNQTIGHDQLKPELSIGLEPPVTWATATDYEAGQTVFTGLGYYRATADHTSSVSFAADLATGLWELLIDFQSSLAEELPAVVEPIVEGMAPGIVDDALAQVPAIVTPMIEAAAPGIVAQAAALNLRRYVDVFDYVPANDMLDCWDGVASALVDAADRELVFTAGAVGGTRTYRFTDRTKGRLYLPKKARLIWEPGAVMDFSSWGRSGTVSPYLYCQGDTAAATALASDGAEGATTLTLASGLGGDYARGDQGILVSDALFTTEDSGLGTKGEWVKIASVAGDVLTLVGRLRDTYLTTDNARLHRMTAPAELTLENVQILGAGRRTADELGDRGIQIINGVNCQVKGGWVKYADFNGVSFTNILGGRIDGVYVENEPKGGVNTQNQYPFVLVNACDGTVVSSCFADGGKEGFCLSVTGGIQAVTRNATFDTCLARNMWRSGFCSHDAHTAWHVLNCTAEDCEQGLDIRIQDAVVDNFTARRMGRHGGTLDCAIHIGSGAGQVRITNLKVIDALRGVWMPSAIVHETIPGNISIDGAVMRGIRGHGVLLDHRTDVNPAMTGALGTVNISNVDMVAVTSTTVPQGINLHGKWSNPTLRDIVLQGGNGGAAVVMRATSNGGGTGGSINPDIEVTYGSGFVSSVVQHATGVTKVREKLIGGYAPGEVLRASKTHDWGDIAGGAVLGEPVTCAGATIDDYAKASMSIAHVGIRLDAWVTATDTVTVYATNQTGGAINLASGTLYVEVTKR
ncbi:MAG TPA: hypothetical protein PLC06_07750 [Promineifilum sp.]|nr:hypothetical protein [Promineifilum sp.]